MGTLSKLPPHLFNELNVKKIALNYHLQSSKLPAMHRYLGGSCLDSKQIKHLNLNYVYFDYS